MAQNSYRNNLQKVKKPQYGTSRRALEGRSTQLPPLHSKDISISQDISAGANMNNTGHNYNSKSNEGFDNIPEMDDGRKETIEEVNEM